MSATHERTDVIVVGGGLVGAACAVAFARQGFEVALLDTRPLSALLEASAAGTLDSRIYTITPGNMQWLESLGVWQGLDHTRVAVIDEMDVWADRDAEIHTGPTLTFSANEAGLAHLAHVVEESALRTALLQAAQQAGVGIAAGECVSLEIRDDGARLHLMDGRVLDAALVVGADGANSTIRELAGIVNHSQSYAQKGIVANFKAVRPHQNIARQWFTEAGVMAWLPLPENRISIVWSAKGADHLLSLEPEEFAGEVEAVGGGLLGGLEIVTPQKGFGLSMGMAEAMVKRRVVLVGDAAHQVHPLAGQGVNLGFRDVITLAEVLDQAKAYEDIGSFTLLRRYERARKGDIQSIRLLTHGLNALFGSDFPFVSAIRNWGMKAVDYQSLLKRQLIRQAII